MYNKTQLYSNSTSFIFARPDNSARQMSLYASNIDASGATFNYVAGNQVNNHNSTGANHVGPFTCAKLTETLILQDRHAPRVFSAAFESLDAENTVRCLEGTRVDILDQVYHWIGDGV